MFLLGVIMKKFLLVFCCLLTFGLVLAGCSTVSSISNDSTEVIYNGNAVVNIGGYLYYGNAYSDLSAYTTDSDYTNATKLSYLARLNSNIERSAKGMNYSPSNVENVASQVIAQDNQFMFALKDYIYYVTPNRYKFADADNNSSYHYDYYTFRSCKLNGDSEREIYTTDATVSDIEVLKSGDDYYIVFLSNSNLYSIKINNGKGEVVKLAESVTSIAMPETYQVDLEGSVKDWNEQIYFTVSREDGNGSIVKSIKLGQSAEEAKSIYNTKNVTVSLLDRVGDLIFYSVTQNSQTFVYYNNVKNATTSNAIIRTDEKNNFYAGSSISEVKVINYGQAGQIILYNNGTNLCYLNSNGGRGKLTFSASDASILFINDRLAYLADSTTIYKVDLASCASYTSEQDVELTATAMVVMTSIKAGSLFGFDGDYIYYYAQLEELSETEKENDTSDEEEETAITDIDANFYLYRVAVNTSRTDRYQLIGKTETDKRHS